MSESLRYPEFQSFERCQNSQSGPLFIVASGPSVRKFPLGRYAGYPMMAMNGSISGFPAAGFAPYFYLCDDIGFVQERLELLLQAVELSQRLALSPRVIAALLEREPGVLANRSVYRFERVNRIVGEKRLSDREFARLARENRDIECGYSLFRQKPNRIGFSRNLSVGYFGGRTIPYAGVQLAYHLGFTQVFLIGVDLDSSNGRFYEQGVGAVPSRLEDDYEDYILPCFELMAEKVVNPRFSVYNLSPESRLPARVVPKIGLDQLDALLASS